MIKNLYIKNFKSLKEVDLEMRNLNLLTGLNGSGKSSLIQTLLLLRQSYEIDKGKLTLKNPNNDLFDAGVAEDIYYQFGVEKEIIFNLKLESNPELKWIFGCDIFTKPNDDVLYAKEKYSKENLESCNLFTNSFQYLSTERIGPKNSYPASIEKVEKEKTLGVFGEYAVHFLHLFGNKIEITEKLQHPKSRSDKLIHQTEAWLSEIVGGVRISTEEISNDEIKLDFQFETNRGKTHKFKPKNVGFGLSFLLPVILFICSFQYFLR